MPETEDAGAEDEAVVVAAAAVVVDVVGGDVDESPSHRPPVDEDGDRWDEAGSHPEEPC